MTDKPVLDVDMVQELRQVMGGDFAMLVDSYQRDGEQRLAGIRSAVAEGDGERLRAVSHSFKGSSANLGALRVAEWCLTLEQLGREGQPAEAAAHLDELESHFREALAALRA